MKTGHNFFKVNIDFEYCNDIYSVDAEPYQTLLELKEIIIKKIFPQPKNVHCFYQNCDMYEKEDEQISTLFPFKKKLKIILRKSYKDKKIIKPNKSCAKYDLTKNKEILSKIPKLELGTKLSLKFNHKIKIKSKNNDINTYKFLKKNLLSFSSLHDNKIKERKKSHEVLERLEDEYDDGNELFYYLHKNKIKKYQLIDNNYENNENKDLHPERNSIFSTDIKPRKKLQKISLNKKEINNINFNNINKINKVCQTERFEKENINNLRINTNISDEKNEENNLDAFQDLKNKSTDNNNNNNSNLNNNIDYNNNNTNNNKDNNEINNNLQNQIIEDESHLCPLCKNNIIANYCVKCNKFICKNCLDKCKSENHENIEIKLNQDCLSNINSYALLIISDIQKEVNHIQEYDNELKVFDIKKRRDNVISMFNDIINIYSQITQILKIIYKEKQVKDAMLKYKLDSDRIKEEINEIISKAETYMKSEKNNNEPKFKIMNMQYFFGMINEKQNNHKLLTEKMNIYSLNSNINLNIEKSFNEVEEIMKKISNKENAFELKNKLKEEYEKLLKDQQNISVNKDKKKIALKRKSINKIINIPHLPSILTTDKNNDKSDSSILSKENK